MPNGCSKGRWRHEMIRDESTGFVYRLEDPVDLAARILILLSSPVRPIEIGRRAARDCQERFRPTLIADRFR